MFVIMKAVYANNDLLRTLLQEVNKRIFFPHNEIIADMDGVIINIHRRIKFNYPPLANSISLFGGNSQAIIIQPIILTYRGKLDKEFRLSSCISEEVL